MKLTDKQLRKIIKEELEKVLKENETDKDIGAGKGFLKKILGNRTPNEIARQFRATPEAKVHTRELLDIINNAPKINQASEAMGFDLALPLAQAISLMTLEKGKGLDYAKHFAESAVEAIEMMTQRKGVVGGIKDFFGFEQ